MAEMWHPKSRETHISWVEAIIEEASDDLNDWENSFIESISIQLNANRRLTERQEEILERIYAEKTK